MSRHSIVLIILIASSTSAYAQRGGRGDALQNYLGENRNPSLLLQLKYEKTRLYFSASELRKKLRSNIILTDPATGLTHLYEGVSVKQLVPSGTLNHVSGSLEAFAEHQQELTVLCSDIDFQTTPLVADTVDGKALTGYVPYYLVVKTHQGFVSPLRNVKLIEIKTSRQIR